MGISKAIIKLDNLKHNFKLIQDKINGKQLICAAVKADAYGHGAVETAKALLRYDCDNLAISSVSEALELRNAGISVPIFLLSLSLPEEYPQIIELNLIPLVVSEEQIKALSLLKSKSLTVHLHIDTGMGRIGCLPDETLTLAQLINSRDNIRLGGVCTHFSSADDEGDKGIKSTADQLTVFTAVINQLKEHGIDPGIIHAANSGAVIGYENALFSMVRPGILLYGYYPSHDQKRDLPVKPVMEFTSRITQIRKYKYGETVSYGNTWTAQEETYIATAAAGYGDGVSRQLSNCGEVSIRGKHYPIAGRVTMDQIMINLGPVHDVNLYDTVVFFNDEKTGPSAEDLADTIGTISYEVLCAVSKRVDRIYILEKL